MDCSVLFPRAISLYRSSSSPNAFSPPTRPTRHRFKQEFYDIELIARGGCGRVYRCRSNSDGCLYAVKVQQFRLCLESYFQANKLKEWIMKEARVQARLDHENVCRYYNTWVEESILPLSPTHTPSKVDDVSNQWSEESSDSDVWSLHSLGFTIEHASPDPQLSDKDTAPVKRRKRGKSFLDQYEVSPRSRICFQVEVYIQMSLYDGPVPTLEKWIRTQTTIDPVTNLAFLKQIVNGLDYIHRQGLVHRDIKPANIFLDKFCTIKIGDFGLARDGLEENQFTGVEMYDNTHYPNGSYHTTGVGTPLYSSPEQLNGGRCEHSSDMYSLGITICELYSPYQTQMERISMLTTLRKHGTIPHSIQTKFPAVATLISQLIRQNPTDRPNCHVVKTILLPSIQFELEQLESHPSSQLLTQLADWNQQTHVLLTHLEKSGLSDSHQQAITQLKQLNTQKQTTLTKLQQLIPK